MSNIIWLYGRSGAGKTTLGKMLRDFLEEKGNIVVFLDGDNMRKSINYGIGYSKSARWIAALNMYQEALKLAKLCDYIIVCMITPLIKVRELLYENEINLVYINASLEECMRRDNKELYKNRIEGIGFFEEDDDWDMMIENKDGIEDSFRIMMCTFHLEGIIK